MPFMVRAAAPQARVSQSRRPSQRILWGASAGALAALLASSPALAQADQQCGPVVAGTVQCAPADDAHPTGVRYDLSAQPPQDLTVVVPPETVISTLDDETAGINISTGGGAITVSAAGSTVQTAGWRSTGVRAVTAEGDVTVEAGTVTTSGYRAEGIIADAGNGGNISITADQVSTSGEAAFGVRANTPNGDIAIHTGVVSTYGWGADAIYAATSHGDTTIETGGAYAWGGSARGIVAYASGTTTIHAESVGTSGGGYGTEADATAVTAIGTAVDVAISGGVRTNGDYATGIFARSNLVYSDDEVTPTISVSAGSVSTSGAFSDGIVALNYSEHGATNVEAGTIDTRGAASFGVYAGGYGDVSVKTGNVTTLGTGSQGVHAVSFGGDITVTTGNVATSGENSHGVYAINYSEGSVTVKTGDVKTRRDYSIGIGALSIGDVSVDAHSVQVSGYGSQGIVAYSVAGSVDVHAGSVSTSGGKGTGIGAYSFALGENAHITVDSVDTRGDYAVGALALSAGGTARIDVTGTITTAGAHSEGIAASGLSLDGGDAVVINAGTVITTGGGARGISASGSYGDVVVNVDKVITSGDLGGGRHSTWAEGILASTYGGTIRIDAGSVETSGRGGAGIDAQANFGNISIKADTVSTAGIHAPAIVTAAMDGWTTIEAGTVKTSGDDSEGIIARSVPMDIYSDVDRSISIKAESIATTGNRSDAVYAVGAGAITVDAGTITTTGADARGVYAASIYDDVRVIVDSLKTTGAGATGIFALSPYANVSVEAGNVETRGDATDAIRAGGLNAAVTVQNVTVTGADSRAIDILAAGGDAVLKAGTITGSGAGNIGAVVTSYDGDTSIQVDRITLTGAGSIGIAASAIGGNLTVSSGAVSTTGTAIDATASGDVAITVRGATKSQGDAIVAAGNNISLTIASGGSVSGVNGIVVSAQTYVPPAEPGEDEAQSLRAAADPMHRFTLTNAGLLEGGSGYALRVDAGTATVTNSGTIKGRLLLGDGDDLLTNTGLFLATADSDFGTGNDRFVNQGTVGIGAAGAPAASVTLLGLDRFENAGGTIDLSNGHAGDTFTLPKDYVGSNGARVALDVGGGTTDRLVIGGAATGSTTVLLADVGNANAVLTGQAPVALIQVGAGSSANAFTLANSDIGLVHYDLGFDAASGKFLLRNAAGTPVYRLARLSETLANAWSRGTDTVATHLAGVRDAGTARSGALWGIFGGGSERIRQTRSINGGDVAVGYRQDEVEARIGYDFTGGNAGRPGFGLTGGYINSKVNFSGSAAHATADSLDLGGYGRLSSGRFFASGAVSVAFHSLKVVDRELGYSDDVSGRSVGAQAEAGARFGGNAFFVEPSARLSWSHTSLDDVAALSQTVSLDGLTSVRGTFGARLGGTTHLGSTSATFYGGVHYVHEFAGKSDATLFSSTASDTISGLALPDQVRASIGASIGGTGPVSGFVQADGAFGSGRRGAGGRIGIRYGF